MNAYFALSGLLSDFADCHGTRCVPLGNFALSGLPHTIKNANNNGTLLTCACLDATTDNINFDFDKESNTLNKMISNYSPLIQ